MAEKDSVFNSIPELNYQEGADEVNLKEFEKVIKSRRSVRVYGKDPVPDAVVQECLEWALLAPNSSNLQPWDFYWVKSDEKKAKLVEYCLGQPAAATAPVLIVCVARTDTWKQNAREMLEIFKSAPNSPKAVINYYSKLVPFAYNQGPFGLLGLAKRLILNLAGLKKPTPREPVSHADMKVWAAKSTALACENLMLSFRAHGFDSCPMEGIDSRRIKKLLKLSKGAFPAMVVSAGKRAPNGIYGPRLRYDSKRFIHKI